jgi:hypothetical protein
MSIGERVEGRIALSIPVFLAHSLTPNEAEAAVTENVSTSGARASTKRHWQPGETLRISRSWGKFHLPARVAYCQQLSKDTFCVGLSFTSPYAGWWEGTQDAT